MSFQQFESLQWRKSSHSTTHGTDCVELAAGAIVLARDSKDPTGPMLGFTRGEWRGFLDEVKRGAFDLM
ncbi:DUF397 domain-containing protein [Actinomadura sp. BRA 177]|uniref:DUF397 domain-containing protein n=1 Tax=Actinomadura sp. BRA 177 TaxID=2745202 RepID=UPI00159531EA|nr:DUF397 domain-containing protein [Actinomadura sp. BRA 177]NVI92459.1 DUF397 domain-containing protein [Actinomadura sp. BRA 177]